MKKREPLSKEEIEKKRKTKKPNYYIDNETLEKEVMRYKKFAEEWVKDNPDKVVDGCKKPVAPLEDFPEIGRAIYDVATRLVTKRCWRDGVLDAEDVVSDLYYDMLKYLTNFDPERGTIFTFLTMIGESSLRRAYHAKMARDEKVRRYFENVVHEKAMEMVAQSENKIDDPFRLVNMSYTDVFSEDD